MSVCDCSKFGSSHAGCLATSSDSTYCFSPLGFLVAAVQVTYQLFENKNRPFPFLRSTSRDALVIHHMNTCHVYQASGECARVKCMTGCAPSLCNPLCSA